MRFGQWARPRMLPNAPPMFTLLNLLTGVKLRGVIRLNPAAMMGARNSCLRELWARRFYAK